MHPGGRNSGVRKTALLLCMHVRAQLTACSTLLSPVGSIRSPVRTTAGVALAVPEGEFQQMHNRGEPYTWRMGHISGLRTSSLRRLFLFSLLLLVRTLVWYQSGMIIVVPGSPVLCKLPQSPILCGHKGHGQGHFCDCRCESGSGRTRLASSERKFK